LWRRTIGQEPDKKSGPEMKFGAEDVGKLAVEPYGVFGEFVDAAALECGSELRILRKCQQLPDGEPSPANRLIAC
jgi:hypothetical protein